MASALPNNHKGEIILFNYSESVFGRRMVRYLNLRGLPFSQIRVPPNLPRPLLHDRLGIKYRRIPLMAIGRDIYIDTRLMLSKLESFFPENQLGDASNGFNAGFLDILEEWVIDGGFFPRTAGCIPTAAALVQKEEWMKDRSEGSGGMFNIEALRNNRGWCLSQLRIFFGMLEKLLKDGRDWILETKGPGMAEIHAGWVADWAVNMATDMQVSGQDGEGADMRNAINKEEFPKVFAWVERFRGAASAAETNGSGKMDEGKAAEDEVVRKILAAGFTDPESPQVDANDVLGLERGQRVSIAPVDFGFGHRDEGVLLGLSANEAIIEVETPGDNGTLRLHYPRINFKILPIS